MNQLHKYLTEQLKIAEPLDSPSTMADPNHVAITATKKLGLLGLGTGELFTRAAAVSTPVECAAVLIDCLAALPSESEGAPPCPVPTDGFLNLEQAAAYLGYKPEGLRKIVKLKQIQHSQNGRGPIRFRREWLDQFAEKNAGGPKDIGNTPAKRKPAPLPLPAAAFGFDPSLIRS